MTCGQCGAELPRPDVRFCTRCGAPNGAASQPGAPPGHPGAPQPPYGQPPYQPPAGQSYGAPVGPPSYGPPPGEPQAPSSTPLGPILVGAALVLVVLAGIAYWALTQMDNPPIAIGRATPVPPTPTVAPTPTRAPGIGINVPGPQGTPTTITLPIPGISSTPGLPNLPIPGISGSPGLPAIPGASGTQPPSAKLNAEQAREKVKESIASCRLLQTQIELSQVTFEPPTWIVRLPLTGATWRVDDETGAVTPDERATERIWTCR